MIWLVALGIYLLLVTAVVALGPAAKRGDRILAGQEEDR